MTPACYFKQPAYKVLYHHPFLTKSVPLGNSSLTNHLRFITLSHSASANSPLHHQPLQAYSLLACYFLVSVISHMRELDARNSENLIPASKLDKATETIALVAENHTVFSQVSFMRYLQL